MEFCTRLDLLVREWDEDVILSAGSRGQVLFLIVKFVVASLRAFDQLSKRVVLERDNDVHLKL